MSANRGFGVPKFALFFGFGFGSASSKDSPIMPFQWDDGKNRATPMTAK